MQEALPYKTWTSSYSSHEGSTVALKAPTKEDELKKMVSQNAVIVFGKRGCCMIHVVTRLLQGQGVNPAVYEIDDKDENDVVSQLKKFDAGKDDKLQLPAVFIGGQLFGGLDRIMATHISGELIPVLKQARALWL
ncbi:Glutaredoxin domain-containing protein [Heracleum sosnowskyi]|uniref:Glutaredoxin domain-containing protein n=1 Tax=Heracleum sosnowskyi TaxID=360622 RepID=A0AAD8JJ71_9APIA|nr:Glutaredoxin domain-containing protein [Heracleum sosnowskyi]